MGQTENLQPVSCSRYAGPSNELGPPKNQAAVTIIHSKSCRRRRCRPRRASSNLNLFTFYNESATITNELLQGG